MHRAELLRYHPNRFAASRDYFQTLYSLWRGSAPPYGVVSMSQFEGLNETFIRQFWNMHLSTIPLAERPRNTKRAGEEISMFCHAASFFHGGRNIFHFSRGLTELLKLTDVADVLWDPIKLPYSRFYLWFGPQSELWFRDPGHLADGAYVNEIPRRGGRVIDLMVTTASADSPSQDEWNYVLNDDPYYYFSFDTGGPGSTVGQTLQKTVDTSNNFNKDWPRAEIHPAAEQLAAAHGKRLRRLPREQTAQGQKVQEMLEGLPVFREVLKLIMNCLCYLSSPSREVVARFPDSGITRAMTGGSTPLERARARNRAVREGYTRIHFCGDSLNHEVGAVPTGRELSAHWRRGHWRNQAVGPGRSERKLIWIRPTLVRKDRADGGIPGHLYDVDQSE